MNLPNLMLRLNLLEFSREPLVLGALLLEIFHGLEIAALLIHQLQHQVT